MGRGTGPLRERRAGPAGLKLAGVDELELRVEKLVEGGDGLGRHEGVPVFVARAAPGDLLRLRVTERRPDYARAEILEILEGGPGRREAPCPYFARCGGCDLQHLGGEHQLRWKAEAVRETLLRIGGVAMPADVTVRSGPRWGYRMRAQLQVSPPSPQGAQQVGETIRGRQVGYFARGSHELVAIENCPILLDDLSRQIPLLPEALAGHELRRLDVAAGDGGTWTASPVVEGLPHGEVTATVHGLVYGYDARCFFQAHRQLLPDLVEHAVGTDEGELALDLYAGVGLFSLPLARRYRRVVAVEGDRVAARYARRNAQRNKLGNAEVEAVSVEGWLGTAANRELAPDRVVVDPPRSGLSKGVRTWLEERRPRRLTYVSCHAATLARDLKFLSRVFRISRIALIDMFPQTGHMEVVVQLVAGSSETGGAP
jgi:23S rRNA (uracil1939-C5)-methyltransferase